MNSTHVHLCANVYNKKLSYCWGTVRRESIPRMLKWTWKWQPMLKWPSTVLQGHQKWHQSKASVTDFLLVVYSNFCRFTHRFWEIGCETVQWPWNIPKVIDSRITRKLWCSEDSKRMKRKSQFSTIPLSFDAPFPANPREYLHKPYTAKNYVPWATFLSLIVYG